MKIEFLAPQKIVRCYDKWGEITVTQCGDESGVIKRVMQFGSALEQSSVLMEKPYYLIHEYTQIMMLGLAFNTPQHVTLLGLGGGSLVHCISHYFPQTKLQVVELREMVIDVAYQYFDLKKSKNINIVCDDAFSYVENNEQKTDLILSDLYESEGMSDAQLQEKFISNCFELLTTEGILVLNFHRLPEIDSVVIKRITNLFSEVIVCDVFKGNWVLFCFKEPIKLNKKQQLSRVKLLADKTELQLVYYFKQLNSI